MPTKCQELTASPRTQKEYNRPTLYVTHVTSFGLHHHGSTVNSIMFYQFSLSTQLSLQQSLTNVQWCTKIFTHQTSHKNGGGGGLKGQIYRYKELLGVLQSSPWILWKQSWENKRQQKPLNPIKTSWIHY
jgi:hypothetical protein